MKFNTLSLLVDKYEGSNFTFEQLVDAVKKGYRSEQIARLYKTTPGEVNRALVEFEIDPPNVSEDEVLNLYNNGLPTAVIADRLNIRPLAVYYKLIKARKIQKTIPQKPAAISKEDLRRDILNGLDIQQLMNKYNKSMPYLYWLRRNYKIAEPIKPVDVIPVSDQELCDMYQKQMMTIDDIARKFKVTKPTIARRLNRINCLRRSKSEVTLLQHQKKKST